MSACVVRGRRRSSRRSSNGCIRRRSPALAFGTLLINARHILMGASLAPKTTAFSRAQRFLGFFAMADENWAMSERRAAATRLTRDLLSRHDRPTSI